MNTTQFVKYLTYFPNNYIIFKEFLFEYVDRKTTAEKF